MSKHYVSKRALCPFYKDETQQLIRCEGIRDGTCYHMAFASKKDARFHKDHLCYTKEYKHCELYAMREERS